MHTQNDNTKSPPHRDETPDKVQPPFGLLEGKWRKSGSRRDSHQGRKSQDVPNGKIGVMRTLSTITRIRIVRVGAPVRSSPVRRHGWRPLALAISVMSLVSLSAAPALAASTGSSTGTITVATPAVYSVTVSPSTFSFGSCGTNLGASTGSSLGFPNGKCLYGTGSGSVYTTGFTITNTGAAGHIDVNGANAVPSDAGTPWTLCTEQSTCTNDGGLYPGANQFQVNTEADPEGSNAYAILSNSPACDGAFDGGTTGGCSAASGASQIEGLVMTGPESSTDTSSTFTTTLTWTAGP